MPLKVGNELIETIDEGWASYLKDVVPRNAGQAQRDSMEQSFYAGAAITLGAMMTLADDSIDLDAGARAIEVLRQQVLRNGRKWKAVVDAERGH